MTDLPDIETPACPRCDNHGKYPIVRVTDYWRCYLCGHAWPIEDAEIVTSHD